MIKKKVFLLVMTVALILSACSNDDVIDSGAENTGSAIEFRTVSDEKTTLRAAVTDVDNILSFTVTGQWDGGSSASAAYLFNAFGITRGEGNANNWTYTPIMYWPADGAVDFYAYSPSSSRNLSAGLKDYAAGNLITYNVPPVSRNNAQEDFLVAKAIDKSASPVTLNFHHALSRIKFNAKTTRADITYIVDAIELINLYKTASLNLADITEAGSIDYSSGTVQPWKSHSGTTSYTVDMGDSPIYLKSDYASLLGETNAILVMPQVTKAYTATDNNPTDEFAIKVSYKAFADGIYYAGGENDSEVRYFPVIISATQDPIIFEMGRQYTFNLVFGDEAGEDITFTVAVGDWDVITP